jgi:hypothetical protein
MLPRLSQSYRRGGAESLRAIAAGLNARGIPTARGAGQWSAVQVSRVLERAAPKRVVFSPHEVAAELARLGR